MENNIDYNKKSLSRNIDDINKLITNNSELKVNWYEIKINYENTEKQGYTQEILIKSK